MKYGDTEKMIGKHGQKNRGQKDGKKISKIKETD